MLDTHLGVAVQVDHIHPDAEGGDDSIYNFYLVEGPVNRYWKDGLNLQHKRAWVGEIGWRISRAHTKIICAAGRLALGSLATF